MQPGLFRLGTDFGNGAADALAFPVDDERGHYVAEKARVLGAHPERACNAIVNEAERQALKLSERRLREVLEVERHPAAAAASFDDMARQLAEDVVIVHADESDRAIAVHVCFPSGWRPEQIVGRSFLQIHGRIPAFDAVQRSAPSLVEAMISRGPYVRFVWTISADDALDHHPEQGQRALWSPTTPRGFLRVERQTTLPVPEARSAIFAIRTYLYGFETLLPEQRRALASALELMSPEIRAYKRLDAGLSRALELLST